LLFHFLGRTDFGVAIHGVEDVFFSTCAKSRGLGEEKAPRGIAVAFTAFLSQSSIPHHLLPFHFSLRFVLYRDV
jgi:hypothetical protein